MASRLPNELWESIGKRLNTKTDVSRFRAVCKSLRSSVPPFKELLKFPIKVRIQHPDGRNTSFTLSESVVYHVALPSDNPRQRGWLIRVKEGEFGKTQVLHPLSRHAVMRLPKSVPEVFNLLEVRIFELVKVHTLNHRHLFWWDAVHKVALSSQISADSPAVNVLVIGHRRLHCGRLGVDNKKCIKVSPLDPDRNDYEDVLFHKGNFYVVCQDGKAFAVDSCLNVTEIASAVACSAGCHKKNLVESSGELLLVDRCPPFKSCSTSNTKFKVFKLNAVEKKWIEVDREALEDRILFVSDDSCFSVSARDFPGFLGNSIYLSDSFPVEHYRYNALGRPLNQIGEFDLYFDDPSYLKIFYPPPPWTWTWPCYKLFGDYELNGLYELDGQDVSDGDYDSN